MAAVAELADTDTGRTPPQDLDAERSVLGALLLDTQVLPEIIENLFVHHGLSVKKTPRSL